MSYQQKLKMRMLSFADPGRKCGRLFCGLLLWLLLPLWLTACQPGNGNKARRLAEIAPPDASRARLSLFLGLSDPDGPGMRLKMEGLEVLADQVWHAIAPDEIELDSKDIGARQLFLGSCPVPFGDYNRVRFRVTQTALYREDGSYKELSAEPTVVEMGVASSQPLTAGDSRSLFLTWDLAASLEGPERIRPVFTAAAPLRQLPANLVYVACPDIDTIFIVRSDKDWVADSFGLAGQPTYLALDPRTQGERLFILAAREKAIKVVDLASQRVIDVFHIPLVEAADFMTVSPDGTSAYILDAKNSYLSRLDLGTGQLLGRVHLPYRPKFAVCLADQSLLAVSLALSQKVALLDPQSLLEMGSIQTSSEPAGLLALDGRLLIAESGANTVSHYDLNGRQIQSRMTVGFTPLRLLDSDGRIYVSNYDDGSLSVIFPGQTGVGREIFGLGQPLEMTYSLPYHRLYVGDEEEAGLDIIDTTTDQFRGVLRLGARPLGMATLQ